MGDEAAATLEDLAALTAEDALEVKSASTRWTFAPAMAETGALAAEAETEGLWTDSQPVSNCADNTLHTTLDETFQGITSSFHNLASSGKLERILVGGVEAPLSDL